MATLPPLIGVTRACGDVWQVGPSAEELAKADAEAERQEKRCISSGKDIASPDNRFRSGDYM